MEINNKLITVNNLIEGNYYKVLYRSKIDNLWNNPHNVSILGKFIRRNSDSPNIFNNQLEFYQDNKYYIFYHHSNHIYQELDLIERIIKITI